MICMMYRFICIFTWHNMYMYIWIFQYNLYVCNIYMHIHIYIYVFNIYTYRMYAAVCSSISNYSSRSGSCYFELSAHCLYLMFGAVLGRCALSHTGWRRLIWCLKLQVICHQRATNYRALLQKTSHERKASYDATPPCTNTLNVGAYRFTVILILAQRATWCVSHLFSREQHY